jgi:hypothetical protein
MGFLGRVTPITSRIIWSAKAQVISDHGLFWKPERRITIFRIAALCSLLSVLVKS